VTLTWGFLVVFTLFIFPGMIIRRLYFYGEFSKQFGYSEPLIKTISYSLIPGIINAVCVYYIFDYFFTQIDLGAVIDNYKAIADPLYKFKDIDGEPIQDTFKDNVMPFLGFTYLNASIFGLLSGRFIRIFGIDTALKLFRFKNQWFYLFNGYHFKLKKYRFLKKKNKKFLFAQADILIDSTSGTQLYSGVIVDYELKEDNCKELSKVVIRNAARYHTDSGTGIREAKHIPGNLLVVDCSKLLNINLTYVYSPLKGFFETKYPKYIYRFFSILTVLIIPSFIYQIQWVNWGSYVSLFNLSFFERFFYYLFVIQTIQIFNPFIEIKPKGLFQWISRSYLGGKIIGSGLTLGLAKLIEVIVGLFN
jgi:hypothetical protein